MSYYVIRDKYAVPGFLFSALASWMIALPVMAIVTLILSAIPGASHSDLLAGLPWPISALLFAFVLGGFGAYLRLNPGIILYALVVWKKDKRKVDGPQPLS